MNRNHFGSRFEDFLEEDGRLNESTAVAIKRIACSSLDDDSSATRTIVAVSLVRHGDERLVARSQAKALLAGVERFSTVVFDFAGIESIGQAFADEIFRVFARAHPDIELVPINASEQVSKMIRRAEGA